MLLALTMLILHSGAGVEIIVNPEHITNMRNPEQPNNKHFAPSVKCQINLADGKFVAVRETCAEVRKLIGER